jgi:ribosomal protein L33
MYLRETVTQSTLEPAVRNIYVYIEFNLTWIFKSFNGVINLWQFIAATFQKSVHKRNYIHSIDISDIPLYFLPETLWFSSVVVVVGVVVVGYSHVPFVPKTKYEAASRLMIKQFCKQCKKYSTWKKNWITLHNINTRYRLRQLTT